MTIDVISAQDGTVSGHGNVAERLIANNMDVSALRTNAVLRKDEWEQLDAALISVARERLTAAADLMDRGLVYNVPNGMGTTIVQHETVSEMTEAQVSMDGITKGENDRVTFSLVSTPLPIIHHDFQISARVLAASRTSGAPLDTTQVEEAVRQVAETTEGLVLNGYSGGDLLGFGSSSAQLFGYTNRTGRNVYSIGTDWDDAAATGSTILADVLNMISAAHGDHMFGPYVLYVPTNYWVALQDDFKPDSDKTILNRLLDISGIEAIKPADKLADDNVLLVQMTKSNVDMVVGMQPTTVEWESQGGMMMMFKVMSIMVPRVKLDHNGNSGIVHAT